MTNPQNDFIEFLVKISEKWQEIWEKEGIFNADPDRSRKKFFTTIAFPYPNSPFHIGHGRTYVTGDIYSRFMRMNGYNVLFPMGFHYTGTPIIAMADDIARGDKELIKIFKEIYEIPDDIISKLSDPLFMANHFKEEIKKAMKEIGLSIDWRREFTTIDPEFSTFITWQFMKLYEKGYIVRDTHPVGWCPVHHLPVGMHDTKGDVEPEIGEYVLIYFSDTEGNIYPAATLRPETVFGAVAIWINQSSDYVLAEIEDKKFILSEKAANKLSFQIDNIKIIKRFKGSELIGKILINPITGRKVPILNGEFVDPMTGTGVVMSVPAHAPFDYYYLKKSKYFEIVPVIYVEGYNEPLAKYYVEKENPKNNEGLEKLTEIVYRIEYNKGRMDISILEIVKQEFKDKLKELVNKPVPESRKIITEFIISNRLGRKILEIMNRPVYCRCGNEVVVKILKDQWFIDYSNPLWKESAKKLLNMMKIYPEEVRKDFEYVIDWLQKRACARTRGLGTPLIWDKKWIIESLSDSTIYMAYYTISHKIRQYNLRPSQLTYEFWDYVILGNGDVEEVSIRTQIPTNILKELREEFIYWYPLDIRHSGKDLIPNHLTFFIFNHAAIFPEELWPKAIAVNGFVLYEGKKMSKSLRNIVPLRKAIKNYSPDVVRVVLTATADMGSDTNFNDAYARAFSDTLRKYYELIKSSKEFQGSSYGFAERFLESKLQTLIKEVTKNMQNLRFREAANLLFYEFEEILKWYFEVVQSENREPNAKLLFSVWNNWIRMIAPFVPHFAEEMWRELGNNTFVSLEKWPIPNENLINEKIELMRDYQLKVLDDIKSIFSIYKSLPTKILIYISDQKYYEILNIIINEIEKGLTLKKIIEKYKPSDPKLYQKLYNYALQLDDKSKKMLRENINEKEALRLIIPLIKTKFNVKDIIIDDIANIDKNKYNKEALPLRPAIILE
jgi:leucyl-tRNA synthetase